MVHGFAEFVVEVMFVIGFFFVDFSEKVHVLGGSYEFLNVFFGPVFPSFEN